MHLVNLRRFLIVIKHAGITLNLQKAEFAKPSVKFIGHIIGSGLKAIDPDKVSSIMSIAAPKTYKQLKRFLGMMAYHKSSIDHHAEMAKPLTDLTAVKYSKRPLPWSTEHQQSFDNLKQALCHAVALRVPRLGGLFILRTDASNVAIAGCLYQRDDDDLDEVDVKGEGEKPICFFSQKLTGSQVHWSTIEKEAYAVIASLNKFEHIVYSARIVVFSDHNPLSFLVDCVTKSAKLTRWNLALQQFNIVLNYSKGSYNVVADFFSRCNTV
jgi:hypothetical protein